MNTLFIEEAKWVPKRRSTEIEINSKTVRLNFKILKKRRLPFAKIKLLSVFLAEEDSGSLCAVDRKTCETRSLCTTVIRI